MTGSLWRKAATCKVFSPNKIKCPVLVLGAELDKITTAEGSREIAEKLGCKVHIFPNEGHAAYLGKDFNRMVYEFFTKE